MRLQRFSFPAFLAALEQGKVLVDFDARSGHNHGTKFRMRKDCLPILYANATVIVPSQPEQRSPGRRPPGDAQGARHAARRRS